MTIIETFERGRQPRAPPHTVAPIRDDAVVTRYDPHLSFTAWPGGLDDRSHASSCA